MCCLQDFVSHSVMIFIVCDASYPMGVSAMVILPDFHEVGVTFHCGCLLEMTERM